MISCYILSEPSSMNTLKKYIEWFPFTKLSGQAFPDAKGLDSIIQENTDILFVDIALATSHRATLLEIGQTTTIIYIANCFSHAYEAFDILGFDFLMMPLKFERFMLSMHKFKRFYLLSAAEEPKREDIITDSFFVRVDSKGQKEVLVKCKEVLFIEALQNYVVLQLIDDKQLICHNTMKEMVESLPEEIFVRIHKSFIINYDHVTMVEGNNIMLNEKHKVLIGTTYKKAFLERKSQKMIKKRNFIQTFDYSITASICLFYAMISCVDTFGLTLLNLI